MTERINSELIFSNNDADNGKEYMFLHMKWGGVAPLFVDIIGDALVDAISPKLREIRKMAQDAREAKAATAAAPEA